MFRRGYQANAGNIDARAYLFISSDIILTSTRTNKSVHIELQELGAQTWARYAQAIMDIEGASYEPSRRDSREFLRAIVKDARGVSLVALADTEVAGFCFGGPLEAFADVHGAQTDPNWGEANTLYSADVTVAAPYRGHGIARQLKAAQIECARTLGYRYLAGRNRVGLAERMWRINRAFGAYQVQFLRNSYNDGLEPRDCIYYHIDL